MTQFAHWLYKRIAIHWFTTLKALVYLVLLYMFYTKHLTVQEWILATGSVMTINSLFSKDTNKLVTKPKFQVPDPPKKNKDEDIT